MLRIFRTKALKIPRCQRFRFIATPAIHLRTFQGSAIKLITQQLLN
jgi:hypothetical protein